MAQLISYSGEPESKWKEESILQSFRSGDDKENITISKLAFEEIQLAKRHREIIDHSALVSSLSLAPARSNYVTRTHPEYLLNSW